MKLTVDTCCVQASGRSSPFTPVHHQSGSPVLSGRSSPLVRSPAITPTPPTAMSTQGWWQWLLFSGQVVCFVLRRMKVCWWCMYVYCAGTAPYFFLRTWIFWYNCRVRFYYTLSPGVVLYTMRPLTKSSCLSVILCRCRGHRANSRTLSLTDVCERHCPKWWM